MPNRNYLRYEDREKLFEEVLETNPRPIPGTFYIVPKGAFIDTISIKTYGYDRNSDIVDANSALLENRNIEEISGLPQIYPKDKLWLPDEIPEEPALPEKIPFDSPDEIAIRINGKVFKGWTTNSIKRSINSIVDSFSFTAPFNPEDEDSFYLDPDTYLPCDLFIGGELYISGTCENWDPDSSLDATMTTIQVRSKAGAIIDCPSLVPKLNFKNQTLKQIADIILKPFGIKADYFNATDEQIKYTFQDSKRSVTDKVGAYLQGLAKRAGLIINSTFSGNLKLENANLTDPPIMSLIQGQPPLNGIKGSYKGTERFSHHKAISQENGKPNNSFTAEDDTVPVYRPIIFDAKDTRQGNIKQSAEWHRNRSFSKGITYTAIVSTWRDENGDLIRENKLLSVYAPKVSIYSEVKLLVQDVSLSETESSKLATLTLVIPEGYTSDMPEVLFWKR